MKTLCCSDKCERRFECAKHDINNEGISVCENFYSFGTGSITDNGCEIVHWCGEAGNWKMFEPIIVVDDIVAIVKEEMVTITKKEYEELLEYKYMYESLCT